MEIDMTENTQTKVDLFVVIADDDLEDHKLITRAIKECNLNHIVTSVYNGSQLMNLLHKKGFYKSEYTGLPDLIILDLKMPVLSGFEVLQELQQSETLKKIPIYVLSDSNSPADRELAESFGVIRFYSKPFTYKVLRDLMTSICQQAREVKTSNINGENITHETRSRD
jgi:two-component system response regulator